jgi:hypothetical protein
MKGWLISERALAAVIASFALLVAGSVALSAVAISNTNRLAHHTTAALCALRGDLEDRVAQTDRFLGEHPEGFAGIPAATLRANAQGQVRTIRALGIVSCP